MFNKQKMISLFLAAALPLGVSTANAAISAAEADKLGGPELTPMGAERAGNAAGTIPEWTGEAVPMPAGFKDGDHVPNAFPDDKPLFTITAANMDQYAENLTEGTKAMLKTYPDTFNMPVYKTRRTATYPDWVNDNTKKIAQTAEIVDGGNGVAGAKAGVPFPIPKTGMEAIWNHLLRFRGVYFKGVKPQFAPDAAGRYTEDSVMYETYMPYYDANLETDILAYMKVLQLSPPRVAGDLYVIHDAMSPVKKPRAAWRYFAGQRRVRRAPVLAYDTPIPPSKGLRGFDDHDLFVGSPDRYDWKIVGKEEIYIPYNAYPLANTDLSTADVLRPGHLNSDHTRYELHRVWKVEGTLKPGARHQYSKRVQYIDEDSWSMVYSDRYDNRGELWRVSMGHLINFPATPMMMYQTEVHHDLVSRMYNATSIINDEPEGHSFNNASPPLSHFSTGAMRRSGVR